MPINERGEFVRARPVARSETMSPSSPPRRSPPRGGTAVLIFLVLGVVVFLVWQSVSSSQRSAPSAVYSPPPVSPTITSNPPVLNAVPVNPPQWERVRPTGNVPAVGATVKGIQFFESGPGQVPKESREYTRRFASRGTRYINWELNLVSPAHASNMTLVIETVWHSPDGSVYARQATNSDVHGDWTDYWLTAGWGNANGTSFPPGAYQLDFFVDGSLIAREGVEVYDGEAPPAMYVQAIDAKVSQPLRFFPSESEVSPKDRRTYFLQFSRGRVWYINWELNLVFPRKDSRVNFTIHEVWAKPDGSIDHESNFAAYVEGGWSYSYYNAGWGRTGGGGWQELGTYRVDLFVENRKIAGGNFEIVE
jgi:hypothetical protein